MSPIDFLITNNRHHASAARLVATELIGRGTECRLVSLCELRGLPTPEAEFHAAGIPVLRLLRSEIRRSPSEGGSREVRPALWLRRSLHRIAWIALLRGPVRRWLADEPDLVVIPNDAAFPYDLICRELRERGLRFMVLQEGIRFTETVSQASGIIDQGRSGATAVACWGETSAQFFRQRGTPDASVRLTGNPRFDHVTQTDWGAEALRLAERLPRGQLTLTLASNPIESWGFCSRSDKISLVERLVSGSEPLFEEDGLHLIFKIHSSETFDDFAGIAKRSRFGDRITVLSDAPLYPLLHLSDAAIIFASTVGLEALLLGVPLGVLEIPGTGYLHDFVSSGAARAIAWEQAIAPQLRALLDPQQVPQEKVENYLHETLACRGTATLSVADLISDLVRPGGDVG